MKVVPLTLSQANELVALLHRHHKPVVGHRFSIGVRDKEGKLCGAAIVGRPVGRKNDQYNCAEITRLVTNGHKNACSFLYGACARIAREMGFERIQTFILAEEGGISLVASGYKFDGISRGGSWNVPTRKGRREDQPKQWKQRWKRDF